MSRWVLVTRPDDELGSLRAVLSPVGIDVIAMPVLRERPFDDEPGWGELPGRLSSIRWLAFTSPRAPQALREGAARRELWDALRALPAAAVGQATATAAQAAGLAVHLTGESGGRSLAAALGGRLTGGDTVLHPCGREHRQELGESLARRDVTVFPLVVYAMEPTPLDELPRLPGEPPLAVVLTSPRAAEAYRRAVGGGNASVLHLAFGTTTRDAATRLGIAAKSLPRPTPESVLEELCQICS